MSFIGLSNCAVGSDRDDTCDDRCNRLTVVIMVVIMKTVICTWSCLPFFFSSRIKKRLRTLYLRRSFRCPRANQYSNTSWANWPNAFLLCSRKRSCIYYVCRSNQFLIEPSSVSTDWLVIVDDFFLLANSICWLSKGRLYLKMVLS